MSITVKRTILFVIEQKRVRVTSLKQTIECYAVGEVRVMFEDRGIVVKGGCGQLC